MDRKSSVCSTSCSRGGGSSSSRSAGGGDQHVKVQCELCSVAATLYCAADEARLCWDCDARIHSANFLVARHSRAPLCLYCGALMNSGSLLHTCRLHICTACIEALHSDEESKVECMSDESCSDDDDESPSCRRIPLNRARKRRAPDLTLAIEGVGDSEEDDYCHLLFHSSSATFKRRNTLLPHHIVEC